MTANGFSLVIPLIFCLAGFHGIFFYENLARKIAAWLFFQWGLIVLLFQITSSAGPLPRALVLEAGLAVVCLSLLMGLLCLKLWKKHKTLQGGEIAKRVSK